MPGEIRRRAGDRCEYCHLPQSAFGRPFHIDPETDRVAALFHPRKNNWDDHFLAAITSNKPPGIVIHGLTAVGRATVRVLSEAREQGRFYKTKCWSGSRR